MANEKKEAPFYIIPFSRKTLVTKQMMLKGTDVEVMILKLQEDERLLLIKCGNPCNTATLLRDWDECCYPEKKSEFFTLPENGIYYFWIQNTQGKSSKAELIRSVDYDGQNTHVIFQSGSEVTIRLFGDNS